MLQNVNKLNRALEGVVAVCKICSGVYLSIAVCGWAVDGGKDGMTRWLESVLIWGW